MWVTPKSAAASSVVVDFLLFLEHVMITFDRFDASLHSTSEGHDSDVSLLEAKKQKQKYDTLIATTGDLHAASL
jgi:hypothetical protein